MRRSCGSVDPPSLGCPAPSPVPRGRPAGAMTALPYSSAPSSPSSSIWTNPLVSNSSCRGASGPSPLSPTFGHELDDHPLVTLDKGVDEELVGTRLELEVLEGVHVDRDRDRREVRRHVGLVGDDALHPAGPVRHQVPAAEVAVRDGLLEDRPEEVVDVRPARHESLVDEELRGRFARHDGLLPRARRGWGAAIAAPAFRRRRRDMVRAIATADGRPGSTRAGESRPMPAAV